MTDRPEQPAQPEYLRIAADIRAAIAGGTYRPGDQLPTLPELAERNGVSETTVRNALAVLRTEGIIETRARAGTIVRERPPVHRLPAERYRNRSGAQETAYTRDEGTEWPEYRLDKRYEQVTAGPELAALFECEPGEALLARHFTFYTSGRPTQMSTSYLRWSDVRGTQVADPICEPWPGGTRAQLATLGIRAVRVEESLTAGMPTEHEAAALQIGRGVPVIRITRRHIAEGGRIVEVAHPIVRRGDTTIVDYVIELDD